MINDGTVGVRLRRPMNGLGIAASGLSAQRARMDVIASNIANAETISGPDGQPYRRKLIQLQEVGFEPVLAERTRSAVPGSEEEGFGGVRVAGVAEDTTEGPLVYDPGHPEADDNGYVRMPNVSITDEMVHMMEARRLFEANATVFNAVKSMLRRATQL